MDQFGPDAAAAPTLHKSPMMPPRSSLVTACLTLALDIITRDEIHRGRQREAAA